MRRSIGLLPQGFVACIAGALLALGSSASATESQAEREARFIRLAQINPLYALPAVDLDQMRLAIKALGASRAEILNYTEQQYSSDQTDRVRRSLYPTTFLSEMVVLEEMRRALSREASDLQLSSYQHQLAKVSDAHKSYMQNLKIDLEATGSESNFDGLEFHFGHSSYDHFTFGIGLYIAEAEKVRARADERWSCLSEDNARCEQAAWSVVPRPDLQSFDLSLFGAAPATITYAIRAEGALGGQAAGPGFAVLDSSDCQSDLGASAYLLWEIPTASGVPMFRPDVVSDIFVHDHQIDANSNGYEQLLTALGMTGFLFQPHTNLYACPDAAGDAAELRSMVHVHDFAQSLRELVWETPSDEMQDTLEKIETVAASLRDAEILDSYEVQTLMHLVTRLLAGHSRADLAEALGSEVLARFEETALAYHLKTARFSQSVMNLVYGNTAIGDYVPYAPWEFLEELMFTRNAPELLLGGTNPSVIGLNYPQVERFRDGVSPRLRSYNEDLSDEFDKEAMTQILLTGLLAEWRLGRLQQRPDLFAQ